MNLLETLLAAQGGGAVQQVARNLGIGESDARNAIGKLMPAVSRGIQRNATSPGGLEALTGALSKGNHQQYMDNPAALQGQGAVQEGNAILGHIFGSKDVSRNVAGHAAAETGLDAGILKKMLPLVASLAMGALSKQSAGAGLLGAALGAAGGGGRGGILGAIGSLLGGGRRGGGSNNALSMLSGFLDADKDGSAIDDVLNMAKKFL